MGKKALKIAMFGHKHMLSREGGVEIVVKELSTRMAEKGHHVVCYDRSAHHVSGGEIQDTLNYCGVKIIPVWTLEKKGLAAMTSSISAAWKAAWSDADVVHVHAEGPAAMCWLPKLKGKRIIVTIHGLDWQRAKWGGFASRYIKFGEKQAVKRADEIIVLSHSVQQYFSETYNRKTLYIPNGVSKPRNVAAKEITRLWGLEKNNYVLFLGRIVPEKGLVYLINAWKEIHSNKKLVIAGGSSDTDVFMNELRTISPENVVFTGFQQGTILEELYSNCYVYVLPSDVEGMPLSLLEAMSYGNCCVVSDIPECTEVVEDKAAIFPKGNVEELRNLLQQLVDNPEMVSGYRQRASKFITQKYNWDDLVDQTLELYRAEDPESN